MPAPKQGPLSFNWVLLSLAAIVLTEIVLGVFVGQLVVGRYLSIGTKFLVQGALHLASFFVGGLVVGVISPGLRILEPAMGAMIAVGLMLAVTLFTPYRFMQFDVTKMLIGGTIAFVLALSGAKTGERLMGNL